MPSTGTNFGSFTTHFSFRLLARHRARKLLFERGFRKGGAQARMEPWLSDATHPGIRRGQPSSPKRGLAPFLCRAKILAAFPKPGKRTIQTTVHVFGMRNEYDSGFGPS